MGQWPEGSLTLSSSTIQIGRQVLNWRAGEKKTLQLHLQRRRHPHHHHRHHPRQHHQRRHRQHHHHPSQHQELAQDQHRKAPIKEDCRERRHPVFKNQNMSSKASSGLFCFALLVLLVALHQVEADCLWEEKGLMVAEGEVTGFDLEKKKIEVCTKKGKLKFKKEKRVKKPLKIACNGCRWKGEVICDGDVVQDLYIWWFETHCNKGRLSVIGRSWGEVVKDPRFKP